MLIWWFIMLPNCNIYILRFMSDGNQYYFQKLSTALDHKGGNELSVVLFFLVYTTLSISYWLTLPWPATNKKSCIFNSSCHRKCYWRDFDVADGEQGFTTSATQPLKTYVKSMSKPEKRRKEELPVKLKSIQIS